MRNPKHNLPAYMQLMRMMVHTAYVYRINQFVQLFSVLLQVYLLRMIWTTLYASQSVPAQAMPLETLITYLTLTNLQMWLMFPFLGLFVQRRVREGRIATDLARPVGFLDQLLCQQVGDTVSRLPFLVLAFPIVVVIGQIQLPASLMAGAAYVLSVALAYLIVALIGLLLGLIAFWTLETSGFLMIYRFVSQFFGGALIPITLFPQALQQIASFLPFQTLAFIPVSIYLGQLRGPDILRVIGVQLFWISVLALVANLVWSRAMRRVVIQGG